MNANTTHTDTNTTVAQEAHTPTRRFKKSVIELYSDAVERVVDSKKSAAQISANGNEFKGLNKAILNDAKAELGYKSNKWFNSKQFEEAGLFPRDGDDYGVILFSTKLIDIEGSTKKEKVIRYYRVFNEDALEVIPV